MTTAHDDARALYTELTGRRPDGVWSAPGRVNLIGEHTDYNDGFVLPFAIPQRTFAAVGRRDDDRGRVRVSSRFASDPVEVGLDELDRLFPTAPGASPAVPEWAAYPLGVAWALRQAATGDGPFHGVDIAIASDVPVGAGLSSSAAIEGATASALDELWARVSTAEPSPGSDDARRTKPSAHPPGSWTRWRPCWERPIPLSSSTAVRSRPNSCRSASPRRASPSS